MVMDDERKAHLTHFLSRHIFSEKCTWLVIAGWCSYQKQGQAMLHCNRSMSRCSWTSKRTTRMVFENRACNEANNIFHGKIVTLLE